MMLIKAHDFWNKTKAMVYRQLTHGNKSCQCIRSQTYTNNDIFEHKVNVSIYNWTITTQ